MGTFRRSARCGIAGHSVALLRPPDGRDSPASRSVASLWSPSRSELSWPSAHVWTQLSKCTHSTSPSIYALQTSGNPSNRRPRTRIGLSWHRPQPKQPRQPACSMQPASNWIDQTPLTSFSADMTGKTHTSTVHSGAASRRCLYQRRINNSRPDTRTCGRAVRIPSAYCLSQESVPYSAVGRGPLRRKARGEMDAPSQRRTPARLGGLMRGSCELHWALRSVSFRRHALGMACVGRVSDPFRHCPCSAPHSRLRESLSRACAAEH